MSAKVLAAWALAAALALVALAWLLLGRGADDAAAPAGARDVQERRTAVASVAPTAAAEAPEQRVAADANDVEAEPPPSEPREAPGPVAVLAGRVVDEADRPVPGATVRAWEWFAASRPHEAEAQADGEGRFTLEWTKPRFALSALAPGSSCAESAQGEVQGRSEVAGLRVLLLPEGRVAGRVIGPGGAPVVGAKLSLNASGHSSDRDVTAIPAVFTYRPVAAECTSGPDGRFQLGPVPAGEWGVSVSHPEHLPHSEVLDTADPTQVVELAHGAVLAGRVLAHDGKPASDALVKIRIDLVDRRGRSEADGTFRLAGLPARGRGALAVHAVGNAVHVVPDVEMHPESPNHVQVLLHAPTRIAGRIVDSLGAPLAGVELRVETPEVLDLGYSRERPMTLEWYLDVDTVRSDGEGGFAFEDLRAREYTVVALHPDHPRLRLEQAVPAGTQDLALRFDPADLEKVVLSGQVRDGETGLPVTAFVVTPMESTSATSFGGTGEKIEHAEGRFRIAGVGPGRIVLQVKADGYALWQSSPMELAAGEHRHEVVLRRLRAVRLRVVDQHGAPLPSQVSASFATLDGRAASVDSGLGGSSSHLRLRNGEATASGLPAEVLRLRLHDVPRPAGPVEFDLDLRRQPEGVVELMVELAPPEREVRVQILLFGAAPGADVSEFDGEPGHRTLARVLAREDLWLLDTKAQVVARDVRGELLSTTRIEPGEDGTWSSTTETESSRSEVHDIEYPAALLELPESAASLQASAQGHAPVEVRLDPAKPNLGAPYLLFLRRAP